MTNSIRVIFFQDGGGWIAQGLEHDICVQAENINDLFGRFEVAYDLYSDSEGGLANVRPAPEFVQNLWDRQSGVFTPKYSKRDDIKIAMAA